MSKLLTFFVFCCLATSTVLAQFSLTVANPHFNTNQRTPGIITKPEITVTPAGAYAQVDMVFTINPQSSYKVTDTLEAKMTFDLPEGSFMHDSWLWLTETVIIRAAVIERNRAINIYEGIVKRRRDPSLLYKTGGNSYQLQVYPMVTTYPRKVKLSYTTPIKWQDEKAIVELPLEIFETSEIVPNIFVKVRHDLDFTAPSFTHQLYSAYVSSSTTGEDELLLRGTHYSNNKFDLSYTVANTGMQLFTYPISPTDGVYQLVVPPASFGVDKKLNTVFILDNSDTKNTIYTLDEIKQKLKSSLLSNYSKADSFNVLYEHNGNIVQAFTSWVDMSIVNINSAINNIPSNISKTPGKLESLLKSALAFCSTKSGAESQTVLLSNNYDYTTNQTLVDTMFANIKAHLGGNFTNKMHVINYSRYYIKNANIAYKANEILYNKLILAMGGSMHSYGTWTTHFYNGQYYYKYDLNIGELISGIAKNSGTTTGSYNLNVGVASGFTYSSYNLHPVNRLNMSRHYVETGRYTGNISSGTEVDIQIVSAGNAIQVKDTINVISSGSSSLVQGWTHHFLSELIGRNNSAYAQEIIDSSRNNRVLCDYTAFLALETGDTINSNFDENPNIILHIGKQPDAKKVTVKCFPNPFSNRLTIEFSDEVERLEIFDMTGRKVFSYIVERGKNSYTWNGKDNNGNDLPSGMYMVVGHTADERYTMKVMKQ